ncbi:MAG: CDP-diacylglycerol--glycerol-3-phosphate 3-phosphatidyltransferase [Candidatus Bipolaricaulia bacterium]
MEFNIPNRITLARILMVPLFMIFLLTPIRGGEIIALVIFMIASATDAVDGYIARNWKQITTFGKFADPLADKLLVAAALLSFIQLNQISAVWVMIIISREFLVTGLRIMAISQDLIISASTLGKIKTISHIALVLVILGNSSWNWGEVGEVLKVVFIYLAVALALLSGADYFYRSRGLFSQP